MRFREGRCLAQGHTARGWQNQGGHAGVPDSRVCALDCVATGTGLPSPCHGSGPVYLSFPARETVEQMASVKPADFHASVGRDRHLQGLDKAEAAPSGPSRPPPPQGTKSAESHQSSLTSLEGSGISERLPLKSPCQAGGPHLEVCVCTGHGLRASGPFPASPGASCLQAFAQNACYSCPCQSQSCPTFRACAIAPHTPIPPPGAPLSPLRACDL